MSNPASFAVLTDGGFAKFALKKKRTDPPISADNLRCFIDSISCLVPELEGLRLHRVYYYDAKPLTGKVKRPDGKQIDFSESDLYKISSSQHAEFSRLPFVAMRYGELSFRGWQVKDKIVRSTKAIKQLAPDDLQPNVQQKGVDMRIGMDIAALSLKKQVAVLVLVTGDSDLVPAMKFARREGTQLFLITLGQKVKEMMYEHADIVFDDRELFVACLTDAEMAKHAQDSQPAPVKK